jgi:phosphoribosyl-ATP pyrophosphohydrolase/phosphoribosyl-AMP cyclohydrolase
VREVRTDCDRDCLLVVADPAGPTCHTNTRTCFGESTPTAAGIAAALDAVIAERAQTRPEGSYTAQLFSAGLGRTLAKLGEEAAEVVHAASCESSERLAGEAADLVYHLAVALHQRGIGLGRVLEILKERRERT